MMKIIIALITMMVVLVMLVLIIIIRRRRKNLSRNGLYHFNKPQIKSKEKQKKNNNR